MKRWKALTGAALVAALVIAPLASTGAYAADTPTVGVIGDLQPWSHETNQTTYWANLYKDHKATCYYSEGSSDHGTVSADKKTVTLKPFDQDWPGDHWELLVIKSGSVSNNVIVHPVAGIAYASPVNNGEQQGAVSHWIVCKGTYPAPTVVTPKPPVLKDQCETANDHYGLPEATTGVVYTRSGKDIVATASTGYVFGALPTGWTLNADKTATYAFKPSQFTNNANCEEVVPEPAVFLATPVPPTCETDGSLPSLGEHPNVTLTWNRDFDGPGTYTLTATANPGYEFADGTTVKTHDFTVAGKLGEGDEDCAPPVLNSCVPGEGALSTTTNDLWADWDVRSKGHREYVDGGLHVWTEDNTSDSKVSEIIGKSFALRNTGELDINATANPGNVYPHGPGLNLFVDFDNNGSVDGTLVYEEIYGQDLWVTDTSQQFVRDAAPSHTGGNGSNNHGTINEWLTVFPNAQVKGVAYTLGSGVHGDWTITSIVVNCSVYTFDAVEAPVPAVFSATPVAPSCLSDGALPTLGEHPNVALAFNREYDGPGEYTLTATTNAGYTFPDGETVKTVTFTVAGKLDAEACDPEDPDLVPGVIASQCVGSVPYLGYAVTLPEGYEASSTTPLTITFVHPTDPTQNYSVSNLPLEGTLLWPGASAAAPQQWPGWVLLADGTYQETDGNFAWTRDADTTVLFEVNPSYTATVNYPSESELCANPTIDPTGALPATGAPDMMPWGIGGAAMLLAGAAALIVMRRFARR